MQVALLPIHDQLVGEPAGLGAFTAVGAALAEGLAGEALPRIGHAQGAVHEHLQRHVQLTLPQLALQAAQVGEGQLAGEHHPRTPQRCSLRDTGRAGDRHLGGSMDRQLRRQDAGQARQADVLNDQRINPCRRRRLHQRCGILQLIAEHQHVDGKEALDPALVQPVHHVRQLADLKVGRTHAGIERLHAEIDSIGTIGHRGPQGLPVAGRRQQFGNRRHQRANRWAGSNTWSASALPSNRQCQGS